MKNIHLLPTDKPSRIRIGNNGNFVFGLIQNSIASKNDSYTNQNIYIIDDSEIKDVRPHKGKWQLEGGLILNKLPDYLTDLSECKLIIMTTDPELIADGVQSINDEFLQWFIMNPSCEYIEVINNETGNYREFDSTPNLLYKIIIPQEEPKQYPIGGYAPGNYMCTCVICKQQFFGDKRAVQCEPCAISMTKEEPKNTCPKCRTTDFDTCYSIKCPMRQEEPKQETLKQAAEEYYINNIFCDGITDFEHDIAIRCYIAGAKYQAERMYIDMQEYAEFCIECDRKEMPLLLVQDWYEHYKK
jgi:hypothetical protein